jgi:hypothetical protein
MKFYALSVMPADRPEAQQKLECLVEEARRAIPASRAHPQSCSPRRSPFLRNGT